MKSRPFLAHVLMCTVAACTSVHAQSTTRILGRGGEQPNGLSRGMHRHQVSTDNRWVVFSSSANNPLQANDPFPADTNGKEDVFVHDRATAVNKRVSFNWVDGTQMSGASGYAVIFGNGRYVAYWRSDTFPGELDVYDRDSDGNGTFDELGGTRTIKVVESPGDGFPDISSDGRFVSVAVLGAFDPADVYNGLDVYVFDLDPDGDGLLNPPCPNCATLVSRRTDGGPSNGRSYTSTISGDGRYVVFTSEATNLSDDFTDVLGNVDVFVRDRDADGNGLLDETGAGRTRTWCASRGVGGAEGDGLAYHIVISQDGSTIAFDSSSSNLLPPGRDTNGVHDVFARTLGTNALVRVSTDSAGLESDSACILDSISSDGRKVTFYSSSQFLVRPDGSNLLEVFVHDRNAIPGGSWDVPGRVATRRVEWDYRCTMTPPQYDVDALAELGTLSPDGSLVVLTTAASDLVPDDTNQLQDVFIRDLGACLPTSISMHPSLYPPLARDMGALTYHPMVNVCPPGRAFELRASAIGDGSLAYQWLREGQALSDGLANGTTFAGTNTPILSISPPAPYSGFPQPLGTYVVRVTNACECGIAESRPTTISLNFAADVDDGSMTGTPDGGVTIDDLLYYLWIFEGNGCSP